MTTVRFASSAISAICTVVSVVVALIGQPFIGRKLLLAQKTAGLQAFQKFAKEAREDEKRLLTASDKTIKQKAFNEFLNFLEMNAAAFNDDLFPKTTKGMVKEKLRDAIVVIQKLAEWHSKFESAVTTESTFIDLLFLWRKIEGI